MTLFRSKPTEVEAVQWDGNNVPEVAHFVPYHKHLFDYGVPGKVSLKIKAGVDGAQDFVPVPVGHWVVRNPGDNTHYWPVDPEFFARKYEEALCSD